MSQIDSWLKELVIKIAKEDISIEAITENSDFIRDFAYDSINVIQLIIGIEDKLGIEIEDEEMDIDIFTKYGPLREFVASCLNKQGK